MINCHIPPKITIGFSQAKLPKQGSAYLQLVRELKFVREQNRYLSFRFWFIRKKTFKLRGIESNNDCISGE